MPEEVSAAHHVLPSACLSSGSDQGASSGSKPDLLHTPGHHPEVHHSLIDHLLMHLIGENLTLNSHLCDMSYGFFLN